MGSYSESLQKVIHAIEEQQPKQKDAVWCVGEQLKDLLRAEPQYAEMVLQDLRNKEQSLAAVEQKIADQAKKNQRNRVGFVSPMEAEEIIRKVYGIPARGSAPEAPAQPVTPAAPAEPARKGKIMDLGAFF